MSIEAYKKAIDALKELAIKPHYYCEDTWYSCPLAPEGCADDRKPPDKCDCQAEEHNKKVAKVIEELEDALDEH